MPTKRIQWKRNAGDARDVKIDRENKRILSNYKRRKVHLLYHCGHKYFPCGVYVKIEGIKSTIEGDEVTCKRCKAFMDKKNEESFNYCCCMGTQDKHGKCDGECARYHKDECDGSCGVGDGKCSCPQTDGPKIDDTLLTSGDLFNA
jgi:hypothetical protein